HARALLGDDDVLRLRLELRPDGVIGRIDRRLVALGCRHQAWTALRARIAGRVEDRKAGSAGRGKQPLGRLDRRKGIFPAAIRMDLGELGRRPRPPAVDHVVEIDREQGGARADEDLAPVAGVDLQHVRRDDVLPAMVFEIIAHGVAPVAKAAPTRPAANPNSIEPSVAVQKTASFFLQVPHAAFLTTPTPPSLRYFFSSPSHLRTPT